MEEEDKSVNEEPRRAVCIPTAYPYATTQRGPKLRIG